MPRARSCSRPTGRWGCRATRARARPPCCARSQRWPESAGSSAWPHPPARSTCCAGEADLPARTLQGFLARYRDVGDGIATPEKTEEARRTLGGAVLILDEASMVGTVQMRALTRIAARTDVARLALIGDRRQLRAVEAGQPFGLLQDAGLPTARMDEVVRQRDTDLRPGGAAHGGGRAPHGGGGAWQRRHRDRQRRARGEGGAALAGPRSGSLRAGHGDPGPDARAPCRDQRGRPPGPGRRRACCAAPSWRSSATSTST